jgi:hypothetical protein
MAIEGIHPPCTPGGRLVQGELSLKRRQPFGEKEPTQILEGMRQTSAIRRLADATCGATQLQAVAAR